MPRLTPLAVALRTLAGRPLPPRCRIPREEAIDWLKRMTGQDFGDDPDAWHTWLDAHPVDGFGNARHESPGTLIRIDDGDVFDVGLDDGRRVRAIASRAVMRSLGFPRPGMRLRVRVAAFGCSSVTGAAD